METFGKRLRRLREAAGYTVGRTFAQAISIRPPSLSELENDQSKQPAADTLLRAASLLRVDPAYLLHGEGPPVRSIAVLSDAELRLILIYRDLSPSSRIDLETEANRLHVSEHSQTQSGPNPYPLIRKARRLT
jgi:transcriptional regulator with XRE-family HTH domain